MDPEGLLTDSSDLSLKLEALLDSLEHRFEDVYQEFPDVMDFLQSFSHYEEPEFTEFERKLIVKGTDSLALLEMITDEQIYAKLLRDMVGAMEFLILEHDEKHELKVQLAAREKDDKKAAKKVAKRARQQDNDQKKEMDMLATTLAAVTTAQRQLEARSADLKTENENLKLALAEKSAALMRSEMDHEVWANKASFEIYELEEARDADLDELWELKAELRSMESNLQLNTSWTHDAFANWTPNYYTQYFEPLNMET